ncbi:hypothetical protein LRS13_25140 [Svornostia abyssi]|uniref:Transaldolase n=1 Tax=Svornostia abyssi TaxID=2898438 RepID=A0ABY5PGZ2_9ACTN|nr:hypothetical protein LRS13_25140 [Parviterribacteraceae bacterium J379]
MPFADALMLDSGRLSDVEAARALGFVGGLTTNPTLTIAGLAPDAAPTEDRLIAHVAELAAASPPGPVFAQPFTSEPERAEEQARALGAIAPDRMVIKLVATNEFAGVASRLRDDGFACALTGVFSAGQALCAHQLGCAWIIPYVDRAARAATGRDDMVAALARVLASVDSSTRIVAASVKTLDQVVRSLEDGADAVSVPLGVLEQLCEHPLSRAALTAFDDAVPGPWVGSEH